MATHLPVRHNISTFPDVSIRRVFRWLADDSPKDLTGWTGRFRIGQNGVFLSEPADVVELGGEEGTVSLDVPAGTLDEPGAYWYVLDLIDASEGVVRFVHGALSCLAVYR